MASAFAPDGDEPLGRKLNASPLRAPQLPVPIFYKLDTVVQFLQDFEGFVALQLSDRLLADSVSIIRYLRKNTLACRFCIIGDSTYGDGDVDEISARHLLCGKTVFFGNSNTKPVNSSNTLFVRLNNFNSDVMNKSLECLTKSINGDYRILCDSDETLELVQFPDEKKLVLNWDERQKAATFDKTVIYIGEASDPKILAWSLQNQPVDLLFVHPDSGSVAKNCNDVARILSQRFFLIEKAKDAERVGLVLGSNGNHELSVACLNKLRKLAISAGKIPYTIIVGEPTPQKLANFPEIDVLVLVGSPEASILPSKGFFKPVIHPWEFMMAASGREWKGNFDVDWSKMIDGNIDINLKEYHHSLISGKIRSTELRDGKENSETALTLKASSEIAKLSCHDTRNAREYFGLNQDTTSESSILVEGTDGIAQGYSKEL